MSEGDDRNGSGSPADHRPQRDPLASRGAHRRTPTGLLGSRAREAMRGPREPLPPGAAELQRRRWRTLGLLAVLVLVITVALRPHGSACANRPPPGPNPSDARFWVASAVAGVACPTTGRAVYGLEDTAGQSMVGLDPVADPRGGYLGVFGTRVDPAPTGQSQVLLDRSSNLSGWTRVRVLAPAGAGAPTLAPIPGTGGYLLAYTETTASRTFIRVRYYRSLTALLAAHEAASIDLPLKLSATANAAPSVVSVDWSGALSRSRVTLAFIYATPGAGGKPGPDREAIGVLAGFRTWTASPDTQLDQKLNGLGLRGNHGQQRGFVVARHPWQILEAQDLADTQAGRPAGWRVVLHDLDANQLFALKLGTVDGTFATSFGKPVARVLPAPGGGGRDLVVSLYVFGSGGTRPEAGELLYWTPIGTSF